MGMKQSMLRISRVRLRRSKEFCLDIDRLTLRTGEIVCLAGANGSGKTTFVDILTGLIMADSGAIKIAGKDLHTQGQLAKRVMGYVPDDDGWLVAELTPKEYFGLLETVYKKAGVRTDMKRRVNMLARRLLFTSFDQQMGTLSHGNKKKVQIIAALMHRPQLIVVDELRNGLDPIAIKRAEDLLKDEARRGAAIAAATHDLWWAERFADHIVMIQNGSIALQARTSVILAESGSVEAKFMDIFALA